MRILIFIIASFALFAVFLVDLFGSDAASNQAGWLFVTAFFIIPFLYALIKGYAQNANDHARKREGTTDISPQKFADRVIDRANEMLEAKFGGQTPPVFVYRGNHPNPQNPNITIYGYEVVGRVYDAVEDQTGRRYMAGIAVEHHRAGKVEATFYRMIGDRSIKLRQITHGSVRILAKCLANGAKLYNDEEAKKVVLDADEDEDEFNIDFALKS